MLKHNDKTSYKKAFVAVIITIATLIISSYAFAQDETPIRLIRGLAAVRGQNFRVNSRAFFKVFSSNCVTLRKPHQKVPCL